MQRRNFNTTNRFEKDAALSVRRGKDTRKLRAVIELLVSHQPLPRELKDHPLKGDFKGARDLHIEPDWVLIYEADDENLQLMRTGTHADIFGT